MMTNKGVLTSEERLEILEALKRGNQSHHEIAKRFNRAQSTISKLARDAGITSNHRRKRTSAASDVESTYDKQERVKFVDRSIGTADHMICSGGLTPRDFREVAQAAKVLLDARRSEDVREAEQDEKTNQTWVPLEGMGEMQVDPNTRIGQEMLRLEQELTAEGNVREAEEE